MLDWKTSCLLACFDCAGDMWHGPALPDLLQRRVRALGGLLGWLLLGVFCDKSVSEQLLTGQILLSGVLIGGSIGYFVVSVEAIRDRSLVRFARLATCGLLLGTAAAPRHPPRRAGQLPAGPMDGVAHNEKSIGVVLATMLAPGLGWTLLGLAVGLSEGIAARSLGKLSYGTISSACGGFVGGTLLAWLTS